MVYKRDISEWKMEIFYCFQPLTTHPNLFILCTIVSSNPPITHRGPHRYTRTVRVPIPRPKIPVINRINSRRYFFTGTMNKTPRCWYSRQGGKECRDAWSAGKYIAIVSSSAGRHWNCTTIDTNARSSTWKSVERGTLCILHGASPAPPHFSKH